MNAIMRRIRLLPVVIVVGFALLTVKGFGLLREAQAEEAGSAATAEPFGTASASTDDPAADDTEMASAAEVDVLTSLTKRRQQLDAREQQLAMRENVITAAERRVDTKIASLQALQAEIQKLLGQRDAEEQKQIDSLVKTYASMKPKDAARIFDTLDDDVRLAVAEKLKPDVLAPILAAMQSDEAQKLTLKLADRLKVKVPDVTPPPAPLAPAADGSTASAAAPTTAAIAPAATGAAIPGPAAKAPAQTAANAPATAAAPPAAATPKSGG